MAKNSHLHTVAGYPVGAVPKGQWLVEGCGRSDRLALLAALADYRRQGLIEPICFYFIRSNGDKVPTGHTERG